MSELPKSVGYFDDPSQTLPIHRATHCAVCGYELGDEKQLCRSLMMLGGERSYYFAYHHRCREEQTLDDVEASVVDLIAELHP